MHYDLLAKIKNGLRARKEVIHTPFSKLDFAVAKILAEAGYLEDAQKKSIGKKSVVELRLRYVSKNQPAISDFKIISTPKRHIYMSYRELRPVKQGYGLGVLSTPEGILNNREARKRKVGGEYLFEIW